MPGRPRGQVRRFGGELTQSHHIPENVGGPGLFVTFLAERINALLGKSSRLKAGFSS